ncbi:hypothetical protein [Salinispora arenicola]|uniref:hypothetical protein n=1 Tax=Salinispora arenicola TaxID=168697 RepID=UPI00035E698E|nr:hypothetical protein [Salinispora arenicola]
MNTSYTDATTPSTAGGTVTARHVFISGFNAPEQVDSLRRATGMSPGDMGRWKGNDRVCIDGEHVDAAIAWARKHRRAYEVTATERFEPQQAATPVPAASVPKAHITVHVAGFDGRSHFALIGGELIETIDELPGGEPDWDRGGGCDPWTGDAGFFYPAVSLLNFLQNPSHTPDSH